MKLILSQNPSILLYSLPHSYPSSIESVRCLLKLQNLKMYLSIYTWLTPRLHTKISTFLYIDPLRPDLEMSSCRDFDYVTSFTKFQIFAEI
jgi:hypothetical protein